MKKKDGTKQLSDPKKTIANEVVKIILLCMKEKR